MTQVAPGMIWRFRLILSLVMTEVVATLFDIDGI